MNACNSSLVYQGAEGDQIKRTKVRETVEKHEGQSRQTFHSSHFRDYAVAIVVATKKTFFSAALVSTGSCMTKLFQIVKSLLLSEGAGIKIYTTVS